MKKIAIVCDTSADFTRDEAEAMGIIYVPFTIDANGTSYIDTYDLDLESLYRDMKETKEPIRTACPSPFHFKEAIESAGADECFVVTISSKLSGSHNAAASGIHAVLEEYPHKKIALIDSKSASAGTSNVVSKLYQWIQEGKTFDEVQKAIEDYVEEQNTFFILESMDNLIKNGRIPKLAGKAVNVLNMKPIMKSEHGSIALHQINRGFKKSLMRLGDELIKLSKEKSADLITICYSHAEDKAEMLKKRLQEEIENAKILMVQTKGLASAYADYGGIVVAL